MGIGMGIIIVKTLKSHSLSPPIDPIRSQTDTRQATQTYFLCTTAVSGGLSRHSVCMMRFESVVEIEMDYRSLNLSWRLAT